jgi:hypothetical protein
MYTRLVQRIECPPIEIFYRDYVKKNIPVIITNMVNQWNGFREWTIDDFGEKFGDVKAGIMRLKNGQSDADTYNDSISSAVPVRDIVHSIKKGAGGAEMVLASNTEAFYPMIASDIEVPIYCKDGRFFRSRIYLGPKGLITSLHQDLPDNLYAVVKGSKHITLFAPDDRKFLYPNSVFSKHPNFSRFNPDKPDFKKYPSSERATPIEVYLKEGDLLYIPSLWWHHIRNTEDSIALNFWWNTGWKSAIAWGAATYKRLFQSGL